MSIYLTGGGDQEHFHEMDKLFQAELSKGAKVALLPQATDDYQEAKERLEYYHPNVTIQIVDDPKADLNNFDGLIIEGGNTFQLIRAVRDTHFFNSIKAFFQSGKPIYADSAGAIILGCDIHTAFLGEDADEDHESLQDYRGLDILSGLSLHAHATSAEFEDVQNLLYEIGSPILCLAEETGIVITDKEIKVYGNSDLWFFSFEGMKTISRNNSFSISDN